MDMDSATADSSANAKLYWNAILRKVRTTAKITGKRSVSECTQSENAFDSEDASIAFIKSENVEPQLLWCSFTMASSQKSLNQA